MKSDLEKFKAEMRVWHELGRMRYPTQAHCNVYRALLARHGKDSVLRHFDQINAVLDQADDQARRRDS